MPFPHQMAFLNGRLPIFPPRSWNRVLLVAPEWIHSGLGGRRVFESNMGSEIALKSEKMGHLTATEEWQADSSFPSGCPTLSLEMFHAKRGVAPLTGGSSNWGGNGRFAIVGSARTCRYVLPTEYYALRTA